MAVGEAKVLAGFAQAVERIFRTVVTHPVATVIGKPQFLGDGVPVKAQGVAHAGGDNLHARSVRVIAANLRVLRAGQHADVARRAKRHVELAVRAEAQVFPVVMLLLGQIEDGGHVHRLHSRVAFNAVVTQHLVDGHHVERTLVHGGGGLVQLVHQHPAGALATAVGDLIHPAQAAGAGVDLAAVAARHGANAGRAL